MQIHYILSWKKHTQNKSQKSQFLLIHLISGPGDFIFRESKYNSIVSFVIRLVSELILIVTIEIQY